MKTNDSHSVYIVLRDWSKVRKANTITKKTERFPSLSVLPIKQTKIKCTSKKLN